MAAAIQARIEAGAIDISRGQILSEDTLVSFKGSTGIRPGARTQLAYQVRASHIDPWLRLAATTGEFAPNTFLRVAATSFGVLFVAEWGDITQLTTANLAAKYDPVLVFTGATLGLWAIAAAAVSVGAKSLDLIPVAWTRRITATIMLGLGVYTAVAAVTG